MSNDELEAKLRELPDDVLREIAAGSRAAVTASSGITLSSRLAPWSLVSPRTLSYHVGNWSVPKAKAKAMLAERR